MLLIMESAPAFFSQYVFCKNSRLFSKNDLPSCQNAVVGLIAVKQVARVWPSFLLTLYNVYIILDEYLFMQSSVMKTTACF